MALNKLYFLKNFDAVALTFFRICYDFVLGLAYRYFECAVADADNVDALLNFHPALATGAAHARAGQGVGGRRSAFRRGNEDAILAADSVDGSVVYDFTDGP